MLCTGGRELLRRAGEGGRAWVICNCHGDGRGEKEGIGIRKYMYETFEHKELGTAMGMGKVSVAGTVMGMPVATNSHTASTADHSPP